MALCLWLLSGLFLLRVLGQILVAFFHVGWLPPMVEWYSGLLPYPLLLPSQVVILVVMWRINTGVSGDRGFFTRPRPRFARVVFGFAVLYVGVMIARYFISGGLHPERRFWPPGSIPIVFHFVLAGYLLLLARLAARKASA